MRQELEPGGAVLPVGLAAEVPDETLEFVIRHACRVVFKPPLALKPDFAEAYHNRGSLKEALGHHEEAASDYDMAIALKPDIFNP